MEQYEIVRRFEAVNHANVIRIAKFTKAEGRPVSGGIVRDFKATDLDDTSPGLAEAISPQVKEPLTAQTPIRESWAT